MIHTYQVCHIYFQARSTADAEEGLLFMQEMIELSKQQSQNPEPTAQAVLVPIKDQLGQDQVIVMRAGPSQFGNNLNNGEVVKAPTTVINPFRGCGDIASPETIKGKIAIMERGDCMFIDKVRKVQKFGAVGAIIVDNVPDSNVANSPMFSMSGDGTDDVNIPAVFLFSQDASKLLLARSNNLNIEVTISEFKDIHNFSQYEEESMFQKLKVSVQEFLNKHTGIAFSKTIELGNFKANIGTDKIRITHKEGESVASKYKEPQTNQQWSQIRKGLLHSIFNSKTKELYVPLNILRIYYQTLSGATLEELKNADVITQAEWLLTELLIEHQRHDDIVKLEDVKEVSIVADIEQLIKGKKAFLDAEKEKLAQLNLILETVSELENVYQTKDILDKVFSKLKSDKADDLIVSAKKSDSDDLKNSEVLVDNKDENLSKSSDLLVNNKEDKLIKTKATHTVDEL